MILELKQNTIQVFHLIITKYITLEKLFNFLKWAFQYTKEDLLKKLQKWSELAYRQITPFNDK